MCENGEGDDDDEEREGPITPSCMSAEVGARARAGVSAGAGAEARTGVFAFRACSFASAFSYYIKIITFFSQMRMCKNHTSVSIPKHYQ